MTYAIIAINVLVFVIRLISPQLDDQIFYWGARCGQDVVVNGEVYRLLTSMFLHASIYGFRGALVLQNSLHIVFNMYILYVIGTQVERLFGHVRYAAVYLLGGLAGSVLSAALGGGDGYSVGASGAVFKP
ncbi:MAG: rhomboid family intramembrane serine protease [Anaerolineae bacterium]